MEDMVWLLVSGIILGDFGLDDGWSMMQVEAVAFEVCCFSVLNEFIESFEPNWPMENFTFEEPLLGII